MIAAHMQIDIYSTCIHMHADQYSLHDSGSTNTVEDEKRPTPEADWKQIPSFIRDGKVNLQSATLIHVGSDNDNIIMMLRRALLAATLVLLPLLGLTWVFGILTVNANSTIFAWLFTIFNSLQVSYNSPVAHGMHGQSITLTVKDDNYLRLCIGHVHPFLSRNPKRQGILNVIF